MKRTSVSQRVVVLLTCALCHLIITALSQGCGRARMSASSIPDADDGISTELEQTQGIIETQTVLDQAAKIESEEFNQILELCDTQGNVLQDSSIQYKTHVAPVLISQCSNCHTGNSKQGNFELTPEQIGQAETEASASWILPVGVVLASNKMPPSWKGSLGKELTQNQAKCFKDIVLKWTTLTQAQTAAQSAPEPTSAPEPVPTGSQTYLNTIKQELDQHCVSCHSVNLKLGGLDLSNYVDNQALWQQVAAKVKGGAMPPNTSYPNFNYQRLADIFNGWIDNGRPYGTQASEEVHKLTVSTPAQGSVQTEDFLVAGRCTFGAEVTITHDSLSQNFRCNGTYSFVIRVTESGSQEFKITESDDPSYKISLNISLQLPEQVSQNVRLQELESQCQAQSQTVPKKSMLRLSRTQYLNTVKSLFPNHQDYESLKSSLITPFELFPFDTVNDSLTTYVRFKKLDQSLTDEHLMAQDAVANAFIDIFTSSQTNASLKTRFFGQCINSTPVTNTCVTQWLQNFGLKAWRRPITSAEITNIRSLVPENAQPLEVIKPAIYFLLMSPQFIFHLENNGTLTSQNSTYNLSQYEIASKISYLLSDSPPSSELFEMAKVDSLGSVSGINAAINKVLSTMKPEAEQAFAEFVREWLGVHSISLPNTAKMNAILGQGFTTVSSKQTLSQDMEEEFLSAFTIQTFREGRTFSDLLTSDRFYGKSQSYAQYLNTTRYVENMNAAPQVASRVGFMSSPLFLSNGSEKTNPFDRGGKIFKHVLCQEFPPDARPPQDLGAVADPQEIQTNRAVFESITPNASSCYSSCHQFINPLGFAFESYGPTGKFRDQTERVLNSQGAEIASLQIDSNTVVKLLGQNKAVSGVAELVSNIDESKEAHLCFAKQYFRYSEGRQEAPRDSCLIKSMFIQSQSGSVVDVIRELILSNTFSTRSMN